MASLSTLPRGRIYRVANPAVFDLTVDMALTTGVKLLICGNRLPFYDLAYALAGRVGQRYETILRENIFFSRAETCIQLVDFLCDLEADPMPLLVTDMLAHFSDEDASQVDELFFACQVELQRLGKGGPVLVNGTARPPLEKLGLVLARITHPLDTNR
jgi:hypothetical protein